MARCPTCKTSFREPPGEEGDHACPSCGTAPGVNQLSLFDLETNQPTSPHSGSDTSRAAAEEIRQDASRLRLVVLAEIRHAGSAGMTDAELQTALGMGGNTERPRRRELEQAGRVYNSGQRRPTPSGRQAVVWCANV